jgi:hypothetical protein
VAPPCSPSTRATLDIDLYRDGYGLDQAVDDLRRLAGSDLGDHFRFVYVGHRSILAGDQQPYTDGCRVEFETYIGVQKKGRIRVDLSVGAGLAAEPTVMAPASALDLPRLVGFNYRLYPVVDQVADKVCATMQRYGSRPSSREKDLVDIVVLATTHDVGGAALSRAITAEMRRRRLDHFDQFVVPSEWGPAYEKLARRVPYCAGVVAINDARALASAFLDPVLQGAVNDLWWSHENRAWSGPLVAATA